jgi:hypothetical protein
LEGIDGVGSEIMDSTDPHLSMLLRIHLRPPIGAADPDKSSGIMAVPLHRGASD